MNLWGYLIPPFVYAAKYGLALTAGYCLYRSVTAKDEGQTNADLTRHRYVLGSIGSGKTMLCIHLLQEDYGCGNACVWVSTHGAAQVWGYLPDNAKVLYFHPMQGLGLNLLRRYTKSQAEKSLIASQAVTLFKRLFPGAMGESMIEQCHAACLELLDRDQKEVTLMDLWRVLLDMLKDDMEPQTENEVVIATLETTEKVTKKASLRRLNRILSNPVLARCLSATGDNALDLSMLIDPQQPFALIADIDKGKLGKENADILAEILTSQLEVVLNARSGNERQVSLFYDEFQTYCTEAIHESVEEGRKRGYCLTLAHQTRSQLPRRLAAACELCGTQYLLNLRPQDSSYATKLIDRKAYPAEAFTRLPPRWVIARELCHGRFVVSKFRTPTMKPLRPPMQFKVIEHREKTAAVRMDGVCR